MNDGSPSGSPPASRLAIVTVTDVDGASVSGANVTITTDDPAIDGSFGAFVRPAGRNLYYIEIPAALEWPFAVLVVNAAGFAEYRNAVDLDGSPLLAVLTKA